MFGPDGGLVANAPHIPVHLGSMQETVQYQVRRKSLSGKSNFTVTAKYIDICFLVLIRQKRIFLLDPHVRR